VKTTFTYTAYRKLETLITPDTLTTHSYDPTKGRRTDITLPTGVAHFDYFGASETATGQAPGKLKAITGPYGTNLAFRYLGHLPTATIWTGDVAGKVAWGYNNDFQPISETITDAFGTSAAIKSVTATSINFSRARHSTLVRRRAPMHWRYPTTATAF